MTRLHVASEGQGSPPIVFIHGLGMSATTWSTCMALLRDRHRVMAIDLLGHGQSPVPAEPKEYTRDQALLDIDEVLATLGEPAVLVGHSLGGYLALAHAATRLGTDLGIVVLNTGPGYRDPEKREGWNERSRRNAHRFGVPLQVTELNLQHDSVVMDRLAEIPTPTLVLAGSADRPEYTSSGEYLQRKMPSARLQVIEGGEHSMHETSHAPDVAAAIEAFIATLSTRSPLMTDLPTTMRQIHSLVTSDGRLELSIGTVDMPVPAAHEVLVRVEAAPINPSDLALLLAMADMSQATSTGSGDSTMLGAPIPPALFKSLTARVGEPMPVGNEGAGTVVAAGDSPEAQALLGKLVGFVGGASYGEYRAATAFMCMELPEGATAAQGASCFVNPLTALSMVENMRMDGHTALVHTAAASNLGQMLNRICLADGVQLVNIVRRPEQADILREIGAEHIVDSSAPTFLDDLTQALITTGATIAFDAIGGGKLAGQILSCMEAAANAKATEYSRYGSDVFKQVFVYGGLDRGPTELTRNFGLSWSLSGWLLTPFLGKLGLEGMLRLRQRVSDELTTTFVSHYTDEVSLAGVLSVEAAQTYAKQATGQKFLIRPNAS